MGDAISAIGLIEHLRDPQKFFDAFKLNQATYLFYSLSMFSKIFTLVNCPGSIHTFL